MADESRDAACGEEVEYSHLVNVYMLKKLLDGVESSGGVHAVVEHIDRWGKHEVRYVTGVGTLKGDDGSRFLVLYTMEGRDDE